MAARAASTRAASSASGAPSCSPSSRCSGFLVLTDVLGWSTRSWCRSSSLPALGWLAGLCALAAVTLAVTPAPLAPGLGLLSMLLLLAASIYQFASGKVQPRPEDTLR
jgi:hypothetical protein